MLDICISKALYSYWSEALIQLNHCSGLVVKVSTSRAEGHGFDRRLEQTKVFKTGSRSFPPWRSGLWDVLWLARQCQDNWSVKPFPHDDAYWRPWETSFLKTLWEKEKLLVTSDFSFFHNVFYQTGKLGAIFVKFEIVVCKLYQLGKV